MSISYGTFIAYYIPTTTLSGRKQHGDITEMAPYDILSYILNDGVELNEELLLCWG